MNIVELKKQFLTAKYDFIRTHPQLGGNVLFLTAAGSIAYGTNVDHSDIDLRGVTIETEQALFGLAGFEQFEDQNTDTVVFGLKKFIQLCLNSNPNVLELLGTREEHLVVSTEAGRLLRENAALFLSKRAIQSYGNYAIAQLRRLQNALARDSYPQSEKEKHILNSISSQMEHLQRSYHTFTKNQIRLYIDQSDKEYCDKEIFMDITLSHYPLRDFKNIYSQMSNVIKEYDKLNHRNKKKDELHLNKHAMHLIRLLITGTEILEGHGINTYREKDKALLLAIRGGKYRHEEFFDLFSQYEHSFYAAARNTRLPEEPDYQGAEDLMLKIYAAYHR